MAFEISEIAIRMQVSEAPQPGQRMAHSGSTGESEQTMTSKESAAPDPRLVEECVRQVMQALRRQKER